MMTRPVLTENEIQQATGWALDILRGNLPNFTHKFQPACSCNNFYTPGENVDWTTGFCTGMYWLAWELGGGDEFKTAALTQVDSFLQRIQNRVEVDHHDMGFLYTPSCVAAWQLAMSGVGRKAALLAADNLLGRFQEKGQFFQAWGPLGAEDNYRLIIDCLLNLPLLYWASEETGDETYRHKALAHTKTALQNLIREDSSTYHTYFFNPITGQPVVGVTAQGYRNGSAWARGQAWGVYGLALAFRHTRDKECRPLFYRVADFFLDHLPEDGVPYWDLDFGDGSGEPKDSSAAAIAACGMLEMAPYLPPDKAEKYIHAAKAMAKALYEGYAVRSRRQSNGLLLRGVYAKSSPYNTVTDAGVDECNTWGDYFWLELLCRMQKSWRPYW